MPRRIPTQPFHTTTVRWQSSRSTTSTIEHDNWQITPSQTPPLPPSTELLSSIKSQGKPLVWTENELRAFQILVLDRLGVRRVLKIDWTAVAAHMGTRTPDAIKARFHRMLSEMPNDSRASLMVRKLSHSKHLLTKRKDQKGHYMVWSPQEDDALKTAVALYGAHKWRMISEFVETRRPSQCYNRWRYINSPLSGKRGPPSYWANILYRRTKLSKAGSSDSSSVLSAILNQQLLTAIGRDGSMDTSGGEAGGVVLGTDEGSKGILSAVDRAVLVPFCAEEDKLIIQLVRLHGRKWGHIAKLLNAANQQRHAAADLGNGSPQSPPPQKRMPHWVSERFRQLSQPIESGSADGEESRSDKESLAMIRLFPNGPSPSESNSPRPADHQQAGDATQLATQQKWRRWTVAEDAELTRIVNKALSSESGFISWSDVASQMSSNRSKTQCASRWLLTVGTHLKHTRFSRLEDEAIWPFVLSQCQGKPTKAVQMSGDKQGEVGVGWVSARLRASRSPQALRRRIGRLARVVKWLEEVGGVSDAHLQFELVHRLANTPSDFRIVAKK
ncbi:hypothetical protein FBU59_000079 [Linderina macrospora]|uniref:Uncharacterized protein n=1 Tax=Linderina macrospora TaxID=4868 RepID=A0ACC1JHR1_9FUNG|nr:hypothetical protein FBU59_000079 [Linderina macrospora]